jgi:hypothetical protein
MDGQHTVFSLPWQLLNAADLLTQLHRFLPCLLAGWDIPASLRSVVSNES